MIPVISSSDSDEDVDILPSIDTEAIKGGDLFTLGDSTSDEEAQEELPAPSDALDGSRIEAARDIEWGESTETCEAVAATAIVWSRTSSQGSQRPSSALSSPRTPRKISRHRKAVEMAHDFVWQTDQSPSMTPVRAGSNPSMSPVSSSDDDGERAPASPNRTRTGSIPSSRGSSVRSSEGGGSLQRSVVSGESAHKIAAGGPGLPPSGLVEPRPPAPRVLGQQDGLRMDSSCGRSSAASSRRSSDSEGLRMPT